MFVEGVEFHRMGQNLTLARYPIHWHLLGDAEGQYIQNAAIHNTYNRCVTMHGTNNLRVENNVTFDTVGHCFFMEDGVEHGNEIIHNLAIMTKCHTSKPCVPTNLAAAGRAQDLASEWPAIQGCPASLGQHGGELLDHQSGQHLPGQRGRGFRLERLLDVIAGAPEREVRRHGDQREDLAASHALPRVQGQRRPLQLRLVHVRPEHQRPTTRLV